MIAHKGFIQGSLINLMKVTSSSFKDREKIPEKFTADGQNVNPDLTISEIPKGTRSLVLIFDDPDAKRIAGYTWVHWVLFNIQTKAESVAIKENSTLGMPGQSTYNKPDYHGPDPPKGSGIHNYFFKIFALDLELKLPSMAPLEKINEEMNGHILAKAEIITTYWRD